MPSAGVTQLPTDVYAKSASIYHVYNNKIYNINIHPAMLKIINMNDKTVEEISTGVSEYLGFTVRVIDVKYVNNNTVIVAILYIKSGYLVILRCEVDLSALTATFTEEAGYSLSWISAWEEIAHSAVIPPYLWVAPNKENSDLHCVNLDDGSDVSFSTFGDSYFVRPSTKYVVLNDDIYMQLGRHLAGTGVYMLKLYAHEVTDTGVSVGGADARTQIGAITVFRGDIIFPTGGGGVAGTDNDIVLLDHRGNHLGTINLSSLTGWGDVDTMPGFTIIAKNKSGNYYALLAVRHSTGASSPEGRLYWLEIKRDGSVVSSSLLHSFDVDDGDKFAVQIKPDYSDRTSVPLVDLNSKKVYTIAWTKEGGVDKGYAVEIDISDVWDNIAEFNSGIWIMSGAGIITRIPTTLTLNVTLA